MEGKLRWILITALAPVAWGTTYFVTRRYLPGGYPLYGAAIRSLPAGLLLLVLARRAPTGSWWWRSAVLGCLNAGAFFALVYLVSQLLPTSVAATVMAASPIAMMLIAWAALSERPRPRHLLAGVVGIVGVILILFQGGTGIRLLGVLASVLAMLMSSLGYVLAKRWGHGIDVVSLTSWQLIAGGLLILPVAVAVEGRPPAVGLPALAAYGYLTVVATAVAFSAWFAGLRRLSAGSVGLLGLLNPVTGVLLGTVVAGERLSSRQLVGLGLVALGILAGQPIFGRSSDRPRPAGPGSAGATFERRPAETRDRQAVGTGNATGLR